MTGPLHDILRPGTGVADDHPLVTFAASGSTYTKAQLRDRAETAAWTLAEAGVEPGDRVALMLPNGIEYLELCLAASLAGAIVVHLHTELQGPMLERPLRLTGPRLIVVGDALPRVLGCERPPGLRVVSSEDYATLSAHDRRMPLESVPPRSAAEPICIYSSSGTTGPAKGVTLSHAALYGMADTSQQVLGFGPADVAYSVTPFYHANAIAFMFLAATLAGGRTVFAERFSVSRFWDDVRRYGATRSSLVGSAAGMLLGQSSPGDSGGTLELMAAVPRPKNAAEFEARFGTVLTEFYGSTEANLPIGIPLGQRRDRTCGRLLPDWQARLVDSGGQDVQPGTDGQLLIRPARDGVVSSGYWGEPERTVELWQDLWIHTGDLMRRDSDGWFFFVDRLKDAIRVSGENVPSADVESVVSEFCPAADVAAYGVPSELGDQDIMVALVLPDGVSLDEVIAHCRARLPYFAVPRYAEIVDALPRTPTNRVRKVELRSRGIGPATVDFGRPRRAASAPVAAGG